jgi:hypothetical protein
MKTSANQAVQRAAQAGNIFSHGQFLSMWPCYNSGQINELNQTQSEPKDEMEVPMKPESGPESNPVKVKNPELQILSAALMFQP